MTPSEASHRRGGYSARIEAGDLGLFEAIPSQTWRGDRKSLLVLQRSVRAGGDYTYLEIGSHLGGTLQTFYADERCRRIYSIDKRPAVQPDERGASYRYPDNSTDRMRENLRRAFPDVSPDKLVTFDSDAAEVDARVIEPKPALLFIDGEHTVRALLNDFDFCRRVARPDSIIALHDACLVYQGIRRIKRDCLLAGRTFAGYKLHGHVYAFLFDEACDRHAALLGRHAGNESLYFGLSAAFLLAERGRHRITNALRRAAPPPDPPSR